MNKYTTVIKHEHKQGKSLVFYVIMTIIVRTCWIFEADLVLIKMGLYWPNFSLRVFLIHLFLYAGVYCICTSFLHPRWLNTGLIFFCEFMDLNSTSVHKHAKNKNLANIQPYHMATVALWAGKMNHCYPSWQNQTTCHVTQEKFPWKPNNKSFIDWACLVKIAGYWP